MTVAQQALQVNMLARLHAWLIIQKAECFASGRCELHVGDVLPWRTALCLASSRLLTQTDAGFEGLFIHRCHAQISPVNLWSCAPFASRPLIPWHQQDVFRRRSFSGPLSVNPGNGLLPRPIKSSTQRSNFMPSDFLPFLKGGYFWNFVCSRSTEHWHHRTEKSHRILKQPSDADAPFFLFPFR